MWFILTASYQPIPFVARTGLYVLDVKMAHPGLAVSHVKHVYGDTACNCGHVTQSKPGRCPATANWDVEMSEWRLVGPMLASLIIYLSLRMRLSRPRIQEFLHNWLGIYLSVGVINQTITEGGRASEPVEEELIAEIQQADLAHAAKYPQNSINSPRHLDGLIPLCVPCEELSLT